MRAIERQKPFLALRKTLQHNRFPVGKGTHNLSLRSPHASPTSATTIAMSGAYRAKNALRIRAPTLTCTLTDHYRRIYRTPGLLFFLRPQRQQVACRRSCKSMHEEHLDQLPRRLRREGRRSGGGRVYSSKCFEKAKDTSMKAELDDLRGMTPGSANRTGLQHFTTL